MTFIDLVTDTAQLVGSSIPGLVAGIVGWVRARESEAKAREADSAARDAMAEAARIEAESDARVTRALTDMLAAVRADLDAAQSMAEQAMIGMRKCEARERAVQAELSELRLMIGISR